MVRNMRRRLFRRIDKGIDRVGYWLGGYGIMTGFLGWVSSQLTWARGLGWADFFALGLLGASCVALATAAGLVAWRYYRPLPVAHVPQTAVAKIAASEPVPTMAPPLEKVRLPAYEIENKLRFIDELLALLGGDFQSLMDECDVVLKHAWSGFRDQDYSIAGKRLDETRRGFQDMVARIEAIRDKNRHHDDIRSVTGPTFWNTALPKVDHFYLNYHNAFTYLKPETPALQFWEFLGPARLQLEEACKEMTAWRNKTEGDLQDIRRLITT